MKAIKNFFTPSSPPSPNGRPCGYCKKKFRPMCSAQLCCSQQCARALEWIALSAAHSERLHSERLRTSSHAPPADKDSLIRRAVRESAVRRGTHPAPQAYAAASDDPPFSTEFGIRVPGDQRGLARNHSMPERSARRRAGSQQQVPKKALPPLPMPSSPGHTPGHALRPLRMPDEQSSYRSERYSPRSESSSPTGTLWTSSPTSSSPTLVSHSPVACARPRRATEDSAAFSYARRRHNRSQSDLLSLASTASPSPGSPTSHHVFPSIIPEEQVSYTIQPPLQLQPQDQDQTQIHTNALGLAVKPFLVRTPSHPPNRKQTLVGDAPPIPKRSLSRPTHERAVQPHPRYPNGQLELRRGNSRRGSRPRSNSFGGFLKTSLF